MTPLFRRSYFHLVVFLLILLLTFSGNLDADQVSVLITSSMTFSVTNIAASSTGSPTVTVNYSSASLASGNQLQISVRAASNFTSSWGPAISAQKVTWIISGASAGSGTAGTLSRTQWKQVYLSNPNPSTGSVSLTFSLAAPGSGTQAGTQHLDLEWQFVSTGG